MNVPTLSLPLPPPSLHKKHKVQYQQIHLCARLPQYSGVYKISPFSFPMLLPLSPHPSHYHHTPPTITTPFPLPHPSHYHTLPLSPLPLSHPSHYHTPPTITPSRYHTPSTSPLIIHTTSLQFHIPNHHHILSQLPHYHNPLTPHSSYTTFTPMLVM